MQDLQSDSKVAGRKTVLIVDDDPGILHVLASGLSNQLAMFDVLTAVNGQEAVEVLEQRPVDVLVTDLVMPVMDGFALIAYVTNKRSMLPVVVLSGMAASTMDARLSAYGGLRVLRKPASYQDVARCVLEEIERADRGQLEGIPLAGIVQLVESERRNCTIVVRSGKRRGSLHFESGRLLHAFSDDFHADGEAAALDILGWQDTAVEFEPLPVSVRRSVHTPLQLLLLDLAGVQDRSVAAEPPPAPPADVVLDTLDAPGDAPGTAAATASEWQGPMPAPLEEPVPQPGHLEPDGAEVEPPVEAEASVVTEAPIDTEAPIQTEVDGVDAADTPLDEAYHATPEPPEADRAEAAGQAEHAVWGAADEAALEMEDLSPMVDDMAPLEAAEDPRSEPSESPAQPPTTVPQPTPESEDGHVAAMRGAIERLALRSREAEAALAAVASEVDAFREARRRFDAVEEQRERRRRELEAFRDDVARLAREILGRVDGLFDAMAAEGADGPDGPRPPA